MTKLKAYHNGQHSVNPIVAEFDVIQEGMTKREAFAMAAMQGILSHSFGKGEPADLSIVSVACADALLAELEKGNKK